MECKAECAGLARIESKVDILMDDMYNHGQDGLKTRLIKFMENMDTIRKERELRETAAAEVQRSRRSNAVAIWAVAAVFVLPPTAWVTAKAVDFYSDLYKIVQEWHEVHKSELTHQVSNTQVASTNQISER